MVSSTVSSISVCSHGKIETAAVVVFLNYFRYLISNGSHHSTSTDIYREDWLITCLDIAVFASFCMQVRTDFRPFSGDDSCCFQFFFQILVNTLLIVGALRRISSHLFPWLCVTASCIIIVMVSVSIAEDVILIHRHPPQVMLISTLFFGTSKLGLEHSQFIASLLVMGLGLGLNFFCWLTVFVFRKNLLQDQRMLESGGREITLLSTHFTTFLCFRQTKSDVL